MFKEIAYAVFSLFLFFLAAKEVFSEPNSFLYFLFLIIGCLCWLHHYNVARKERFEKNNTEQSKVSSESLVEDEQSSRESKD